MLNFSVASWFIVSRYMLYGSANHLINLMNIKKKNKCNIIVSLSRILI